MTSIITILAVSLLFVFLFMAASVWLLNWFMSMYIGKKHKLLEDLLRTEEVPKSWSQKFEKRLAHFNNGTSKAEHHPVTIYEQAHRSYIKKLDRLAKYVQKTRLVQDEETRQTLLADLELIRKLWRERYKNELHTF